MKKDLEKDLKNLMYTIEMHHISSEPIQNLIARYKELEKREKERKERIRFLELKILHQKEEIKHLAQNKFKVFLQELLED